MDITKMLQVDPVIFLICTCVVCICISTVVYYICQSSIKRAKIKKK